MNRLYRSETDKMIGGVCGGLGEYLHLDPLILRIAFVVAALALNGVGLMLYLILWVLVPVRHADGLSQEEIIRQNVEEIGVRVRGLGQEARGAFGDHATQTGVTGSNRLLAAGVILAGVGLLMLLNNLGLLWWFRLGRLWPMLLIALGVVMLLNRLKDAR